MPRRCARASWNSTVPPIALQGTMLEEGLRGTPEGCVIQQGHAVGVLICGHAWL